MKQIPKFNQGERVRVTHFDIYKGEVEQFGEIVKPPKSRKPGWSSDECAVVRFDGAWRDEHVSNTRLHKIERGNLR